MTPKVAIYLRVSTTEQTLASQQLELHGFCDRQGWNPAVYEDTASGRAGATRPNLERLMRDVRAGKVNTVVITKLDRLGRSLTHLALILEEFRSRGVSLIAVSQGIDTRSSNPMGALMLGVLAAVSEFELALIRERTQQGLQAAKAAGKRVGRPPLPAEVKDRVKAAAAQFGPKIRMIARELDLSPSTVSRVLKAA